MDTKALRTFYLEELEKNIINLRILIREICQEPSNQQNITNCKILFHTIKGDSGIIGAKNMYKYCSLFESLMIEKAKVILDYSHVLAQSPEALKSILEKDVNESDFDMEETLLIELELNLKDIT